MRARTHCSFTTAFLFSLCPLRHLFLPYACPSDVEKYTQFQFQLQNFALQPFVCISCKWFSRWYLPNEQKANLVQLFPLSVFDADVIIPITNWITSLFPNDQRPSLLGFYSWSSGRWNFRRASPPCFWWMKSLLSYTTTGWWKISAQCGLNQ